MSCFLGSTIGAASRAAAFAFAIRVAIFTRYLETV